MSRLPTEPEANLTGLHLWYDSWIEMHEDACRLKTRGFGLLAADDPNAGRGGPFFGISAFKPVGPPEPGVYHAEEVVSLHIKVSDARVAVACLPEKLVRFLKTAEGRRNLLELMTLEMFDRYHEKLAKEREALPTVWDRIGN